MVLDRRRRFGFLAAAITCFVIAALAFAGVLVGDWVGRVIFGVVWVALGIVWLGSYFGAFFARPREVRTAAAARPNQHIEQTWALGSDTR